MEKNINFLELKAQFPGYLKNKKVYNFSQKRRRDLTPCARTRFGRVASSYDLHDMAGGSPLLVLAASNVHLSSKRRREACNPTKEV